MKKFDNIEEFKVFIRMFTARVTLLEMETETKVDMRVNVEITNEIWYSAINFLKKDLSMFPKIDGSIFTRELGCFEVTFNLHLK